MLEKYMVSQGDIEDYLPVVPVSQMSTGLENILF